MLEQVLAAPFVVDPADVDERAPPGTEPRDLAVALARRKALAVASRRADGAPVLGADTVVVNAAGQVLGKPADAAEARTMLRSLAGTTQLVITGVCLLAEGREIADAVVTRVTMRDMTEAEVEAYIASGEPFGKAGGYAIQETGDRFVTQVDGSWSNVVGLPLERVTQMLRDLGLPLTEPK